jgi:putative DNA primase/helicase
MAEDPRSQDTGQSNRQKPAEESRPHPAENIIRPARQRRAAPDQTREAEARTESERRESRSRRPADANRQVPEHIRKRFVQVGHRYYFPDGAHAFSDRGSRLITTSENTEVVKSLIVIAEERGWRDITVSGTERFRREAWAMGTAAGLNVRGYTPTEFDREQLARRSTREATGGVAESASEPADRTRSKEGAKRRDTSRRRELTLGRLVDHAAAPYRHDPHEPISYFVRIATPDGEREVWGVDLERAIKKSLTQVKRGDEIGLRAVRREAVSVPSARRDEEGRVLGQERLDVHRNHWIVERRDFFAERAAAARSLRDSTVDPKRGARQHPELVGTYLQVHAAEIAARQFRDPEDRQKFVMRVRSALADAVARGEPLAPVRLRERAPTATPASPAREDAPVR